MKTRKVAIDELRRNRVLVDTQKRLITLGRDGPGIKMWRWIDCLCSYYKFHWVRGE